MKSQSNLNTNGENKQMAVNTNSRSVMVITIAFVFGFLYLLKPEVGQELHPINASQARHVLCTEVKERVQHRTQQTKNAEKSVVVM